jgi:putative membrane protein
VTLARHPRWWYAIAGVAVAIVAVTALDAPSDASFAWHMLQHLLLLFIVPLLLLLARPFEPLARVSGKKSTAAFVRATKPLHVLASAPVALGTFVATLWLTHFTGLYEAALQHQAIHVAEHLLYIAAGTLFWLPVLAPPPLRPLPYPARLFYLAIALPQGALVAMAINSARSPLYAQYVATEGWRNALADQSNAAAIMWISGGLLVFVAFLTTLAVWAHRDYQWQSPPRASTDGGGSAASATPARPRAISPFTTATK